MPSTSALAPLLVIEGIDGSGKGTQAKHVCNLLETSGHRCEVLSFPQYDQNFFGARIGDFLNGEFGSLAELHPFLISLLYAGDRFESKDRLQQLREESELVILDRYVPSNLAHQSAKTTGREREQIQQWIEHIEYDVFGLPRPQHVILLDTPTDVSQNLIAQKEARSYTDETADLQESDTDYLSRVRDVYLQLADKRENWSVIPVTDGHQVRSIESIGLDVLQTAQTLLQEL